MRDTLLLAALIGFAGGILCRSLFFYPWEALLFLALLAALSGFVWARHPRLLYLIATVVLLGAFLGSARVMLAPSSSELLAHIGSETTFEGVVVAEPDLRETTQRVTLRLSHEGVEEKVLAVAPLYPRVSYGERVQMTGTLARPEPFATNGGRMFRYDRFLAKDGVFLIAEHASLTPISPPESLPARAVRMLLRLKQGFQEGLVQALPEPHASLASGLLTGGKQGLGLALLDAFIISGLVHIVVLSGYNVMIVAEAVLRLFRFLSRRSAALAAGVVIASFVLVAGAGAASVRAGLMAGLALTARATGRTYAVLRALAAAGFAMLLLNPLLLAFDPGFQLSFLATLGLVLVAPRVSYALRSMRSAFWRELLAATIAAQVSVLPLLLYQTGVLSLVALPANLLVLPAVPLAMLLSAIAGVAGFILPAVAPVLALPAVMLLSYIVSVAEFLAGLPLSSVSVPQFPFILVVAAYVLLGYLVAKAPAAQVGAAGAPGRSA